MPPRTPVGTSSGGAGTPGAAGKNAFTVTTSDTTWGNPNETVFAVVAAGTVEWLRVGQWVALSDNVHTAVATVDTVGAEDPESPGVQVLVLLDHSTAGNPTVGTVIAAGAGLSPSGRPA